MPKNDKNRVFAVRLQDLVNELKLSSTFLDLGCSVLSGTADLCYPASEVVDRGLLMVDTYRMSIDALTLKIEALVKDIDPDL